MGQKDISCVSAGIRPSPDGRSPEEACDAAKPFGLSLSAHTPRPLDELLMNESDLVVVMESSQFWYLRRTYPQHSGRVVLLSLFDASDSAFERFNIPDPFGKPPAAYTACYRRIERAVDTLLAEVLSSC
jgi:protein-tyrosine-phosphatase